MKKLILVLSFCSTILLAQSNPIAGNPYTIKYIPSEKNIFTPDSKISLVYVFNYWSEKNIASDGIEKLFDNILNPDSGRKNEKRMTIKDGQFYTEIFIPDSAQLLSYYFTDGSKFDYNDKKTYISYVFNKNGLPVKGARFRNIDFMIMAGATNNDCINELENELKDYPDYHIDRFVLWSKKFEDEKDFNELLKLKDDFEKDFDDVKTKYPNDYELLNAECKGYIAFQSALSKLTYPYFNSASQKMYEIAEQIPADKRSSIVQRIYDSYQRQKKAETYKDEIIGKVAPDFEFTSITGEKKKLSDFKGKVVLLDFWGTWCGPCVAEIPNLIKTYNHFKNNDFEIISISSDLMMNRINGDEFKKFTKEKGMNWVLTLDDKKGEIHSLYNIAHWPTLFLIDKEGNVIKNETVLRGNDLETTLKEVLMVD